MHTQSDATLTNLRATVAGRYEPERVIGRGGMATVFLAHDLRHDRKVAIKVLHPELAVSVGADRFLAEIAVTARLQHPHILPLHESGQADGALFYVMPFVDGDSLRALLDQNGALPLAETVRITTAVAAALDYAHRQGIIHRDIKPENILLSDGVPVVADFGIARALHAADSTRMTYTGLSVGTPAYMSPEQATGERDLDARADVYSLGCVVYEMLTGQMPFAGTTAHAILVKRFTQEAPSLTEIRADIPTGISAAVRKALALDPDDRFASASAFAAALTPTAVVEPPRPSRRSYSGSRGVSVAVLPFENRSADPEQDYFCDGITDEVIDALARLRGVRLASRTSTRAYRGKDLTVAEVGNALNVSLVLEGSVRVSGDRLRVSTQLIDVNTGFQVWAERFDRQVAEVFAIQDELAAAIADALRARLTSPGIPEPGGMVRHGTQNVDAYHLVLKGRHFWNTRALDKAMECFQKAVALDQNYAQAFSGLADGLSFLNYYAAVPPQVALAKGRGAAERAVVCDPMLADTHYSLGLFEFLCGWDLEMSGRALERALELNPQMGQARATRAQWLACFNRRDEARYESDAALTLEPLSPLIHATVALSAGFAGEHARGLDIVKTGLELDAHSIPCLWVRGVLLVESGAAHEAIESFEHALQSSRRNPLVLGLYGNALAHAGRTSDARAILQEIDSIPQLAAVASGLGGWVLAGLGETDAALERFAASAQHNDPRVLMPLVQPVAGAGVTTSSRYAELIDGRGLADLRAARG